MLVNFKPHATSIKFSCNLPITKTGHSEQLQKLHAHSLKQYKTLLGTLFYIFKIVHMKNSFNDTIQRKKVNST